MTFSIDRIVYLRKQKNITQEEMGNKLGMKRSTYAKKEDVGDFTGEQIIKIAEILGIDDLELTGLELKDPKVDYVKKNVQKFRLMNSSEMVAKDVREIRAIVRVLLRTNAEILASQKKKSIAAIFSEINKAIKDEMGEDFKLF